MKRTLVAWLLASNLCFARGGGEGPCPVPEVPFPQVVTKTFVPTRNAVSELQFFEGAQSLLLRSENLNYERKKIGDSVVSLTAEDFALFLRPGQVTRLMSLGAHDLGTWADRMERVAENVVASVVGNRYDVHEIFGNGAAKTLCSTPAISNLHLSQGGSRDEVYFHAWSGGRLRLFSLRPSTCAWREDARYRGMYPAVSPTFVRTGPGGKGYYSSSRGLVQVNGQKIRTFQVGAKEIYFLGRNAPGILVWTRQEAVAVFMEETERTATLLRWVKKFSAESLAYSPSRRALFLPLWLEAERAGVYEFIFR